MRHLRDFRSLAIFEFFNTIGTFETCRRTVTMSVNRGRAEVLVYGETDANDPRLMSGYERSEASLGQKG